MNANKHHCNVCGHTDHNHRTLPNGKEECPARVIRIKRECGSAVPGSDPGTQAS